MTQKIDNQRSILKFLALEDKWVSCSTIDEHFKEFNYRMPWAYRFMPELERTKLVGKNSHGEYKIRSLKKLWK